uniref:glycosyltransferase family 2 protein n=1 Tax=Algoriphagus sp. TaxID=1872435 RepID=UPI00404801FA
MSFETFFSVIIPTFNREVLIARALKSLSNQTYKNFEVIVVDDGSSDDTKLVCDNFKSQFNNFVYISLPNSGGPAKPRNIGIEHSRGKWICFLDSDDYWYPYKLEVCFHNISSDVDILYHDLLLEGIRGKVSGKKLGDHPFKSLITNGNGIPLSSAVVRSSAIENSRFSERKELASIEDFEFWIQLSLLTNKFKYLNSTLGFYHLDPNIRITQFNEISSQKYLFLKNQLIRSGYCNKREMHFFNYSIAINLYNSVRFKRSIVFFNNVFFNHPNFIYKLKSLLYCINLFILK